MEIKDLPLPPAAMARVVQIAADPECTVGELSNVIRTDPVLSAQVLKSVNSAYYGFSRKVASVERAVSFMGIRAVRNLVLCLGVRQLTLGNFFDYPLEQFWECSLRRAVAAKVLARYLNVTLEEELFTIGLCQDLGVLLIVGQNEDLAPTLGRAINLPADERLSLERAAGAGHEEVGARLFHEWKFPEDLIAPVRFHHDPDNAPEAYRQLARIVFCAEHLADLLWIENKQRSLDQAGEYLREKLGLVDKALDEILNEVSEGVTQAARMLEIKVGHQPDYQEIAEAASRGLLSLNMSYQVLADELKQSLELQQEHSSELERQNRELELLARTDKLTGLPNRRAFDESFDRELSRSTRLNKPVSLILIDIDHFKNFNDAYGHSAGDRVLQKVGQLLMETARKVDIPARYGGEEFAVIMPHTDGPGALIGAERIRKLIAETPVEFEGKTLQVTVSIGVTSLQDASSPRAAVIAVGTADDALYEAKVSGRNRSVLKQ